MPTAAGCPAVMPVPRGVLVAREKFANQREMEESREV